MDQTHLAHKRIAENILHSCTQVLVETDQLKGQLSIPIAHALGSRSHTGCCHMRLHLRMKPAAYVPVADNIKCFPYSCTLTIWHLLAGRSL